MLITERTWWVNGCSLYNSFYFTVCWNFHNKMVLGAKRLSDQGGANYETLSSTYWIEIQWDSIFQALDHQKCSRLEILSVRKGLGILIYCRWMGLSQSPCQSRRPGCLACFLPVPFLPQVVGPLHTMYTVLYPVFSSALDYQHSPTSLNSLCKHCT